MPLVRREEPYQGALSATSDGDMAAGGPDAGTANGHGQADDGGPEKSAGAASAAQARRLVITPRCCSHFREATWDGKPSTWSARRLTEIYAADGPAAIAGFGSASAPNEEAYLSRS